MKNLRLVWLILIVSFGFLISCEEDSGPKNYFKYNGKTYKLNRGFYVNWGSNDNGSYDFDIYFISPSIEVDPVNEEFSGVGELMYLDLNTSSEFGFVGGTYTYSEERLAFTFIGGVVGIDIDMSTEQGTLLEIDGGTIEITVNNDDPLIEFTLTTESGKTVTGKFKGDLEEIF